MPTSSITVLINNPTTEFRGYTPAASKYWKKILENIAPVNKLNNLITEKSLDMPIRFSL